ncbi:Na+/H+ antiporter NhaA [Actinomyces capricornis]|uniref:Na+/H+ antiporter NhaA n=1 Tax=Actinomyces capricornis TaxID=2755559 RepID=UPI0021E10DD1|nr:Na+/H+ antiporter NhaA [Actinomyces capricornis]
MGFTISLLVAGLALDDEALADQARIGVLCASLMALVLAAAIFRLGDRFWPLPRPRARRCGAPSTATATTSSAISTPRSPSSTTRT